MQQIFIPKFQRKKIYLKKLTEFITNDINIDEITEEYCNNNLIEFTYNVQIVKFNPLNCFFVGNDENHLLDIVNKKNFSFEYLKKNNFPLFPDNNDLNHKFQLHVKNILQSDTIREYINNIDNIPISEKSIFSREEILNEIQSNSIWVLFPLAHVYGVTDRETYTIFLNSYFKENTNQKLII